MDDVVNFLNSEGISNYDFKDADRPLSFKDMKVINPNLTLCTYTKFHEYPLSRILTEEKPSCVVLYENNVKIGSVYGHYCCIKLNSRDGELYFFDSYGIYPDDQLKHDNCIDESIYNSLVEKMYDSPYHLRYNEKKLQGKKSETCGRYCALFSLDSTERPERFANYISKLASKCGVTNDKLISFITDFYF